MLPPVWVGRGVSVSVGVAVAVGGGLVGVLVGSGVLVGVLLGTAIGVALAVSMATALVRLQEVVSSATTRIKKYTNGLVFIIHLWYGHLDALLAVKKSYLTLSHSRKVADFFGGLRTAGTPTISSFSFAM